MKRLLWLLPFCFVVAASAQPALQDHEAWMTARYQYSYTVTASGGGNVDLTAKDSVVVEFFSNPRRTTRLLGLECAATEITCGDGTLAIDIQANATYRAFSARTYYWRLVVYEIGVTTPDVWIVGEWVIRGTAEDPSTTGGTSALTVGTASATLTGSSWAEATSLAASAITGLSELAEACASGDFFIIYDVTGTAVKKIDCDNLPSGTSTKLDLANDNTFESTGILGIETTGDTNSIFTEPTADTLRVDLGQDWPKADSADVASDADSLGGVAASSYSTATEATAAEATTAADSTKRMSPRRTKDFVRDNAVQGAYGLTSTLAPTALQAARDESRIEIAAPGGSEDYAFSPTVALRNDSLFVAYRQGTTHNNLDAGKVVLKWSSDWGLSWSDSLEVVGYDSGNSRAPTDPVITAMGNGQLCIHFNYEQSGVYRRLWLTCTYNATTTWPAASVIDDGWPSGWASSSGHLVEEADGDWILPIYGRAVYASGKYHIRLLRSADSGSTWSTYVSAVLNGDTDAVDYEEPQLVKLADGTFAMAVRVDDDGILRWQTTSDITSWTTPFNQIIEGFAAPRFIEFTSGTIILSTRSDLTNYYPLIYTSRDGGTTWTDSTAFDYNRAGDTRRMMYGDFVEIASGLAFHVWSTDDGSLTTTADVVSSYVLDEMGQTPAGFRGVLTAYAPDSSAAEPVLVTYATQDDTLGVVDAAGADTLRTRVGLNHVIVFQNTTTGTNNTNRLSLDDKVFQWRANTTGNTYTPTSDAIFVLEQGATNEAATINLLADDTRSAAISLGDENSAGRFLIEHNNATDIGYIREGSSYWASFHAGGDVHIGGSSAPPGTQRLYVSGGDLNIDATRVYRIGEQWFAGESGGILYLGRPALANGIVLWDDTEVTDSLVVSSGGIRVASLDCTTNANGVTADATGKLACAAPHTDTQCYWLEDPLATDDRQSIWTVNGFAATITKMWCESDQTVNMDLQIDDGTPADVNGTDLVCDSTPAEDEAMGGDATMADGDRLDFAITSVSGTPTWVSMCWTYVKN